MITYSRFKYSLFPLLTRTLDFADPSSQTGRWKYRYQSQAARD